MSALGINLCEECNFNSRVPGTPYCRSCNSAIERERDDDDCGWADDQDLDDPPLYQPGALENKTEQDLQKEWSRQCNIHDHGIDNYEMDHPVIEKASARINLVEAEQLRRGFRKGPKTDD